MSTRMKKGRLKSVALLGATAFGLTALGNYVYEWNADGGAGYWEDLNNWNVMDTANNWASISIDEIDSAVSIDDWRVGNYPSVTEFAIKFRSAVDTDDSAPLYFYGYSAALVADAPEYGLDKHGNLVIAPDWGWGSPNVTLGQGTYSFSEVQIAPSNAKSGSLTLDGGTLVTTAVSGTGSLVVKNGTIDTSDFDTTVSAPITGAGILTMTGAGELDITGNVSNFKGKIVVDKDATGYVTIGNETIFPGETKDFDPQATYTVWTEDFEGATALQGWTYEGSGYGAEIRTRTLADGTSSKYYCYTAQASGAKVLVA